MISLLVTVLVIVIIVGLFRTATLRQGDAQKEFVKGALPVFENTFYTGSAPGYSGSWKGKMMHPEVMSGKNVFETDGKKTEKYPFQMYAAKSIQDNAVQVIRFEYNLSGNPFWVRSAFDEVVQVAEGKFLGKVYVQLIPGYPFLVSFFRMEKATV